MLQQIIGSRITVLLKPPSLDNLPAINPVKFKWTKMGKKGENRFPVVEAAGDSNKMIKAGNHGEDSVQSTHLHQ